MYHTVHPNAVSILQEILHHTGDISTAYVFTRKMGGLPAGPINSDDVYLMEVLLSANPVHRALLLD